jgi:hypothetical protein
MQKETSVFSGIGRHAITTCAPAKQNQVHLRTVAMHVLALFVVLLVGTVLTNADDSVVVTANGPVRGVVASSYRVFKVSCSPPPAVSKVPTNPTLLNTRAFPMPSRLWVCYAGVTPSPTAGGALPHSTPPVPPDPLSIGSGHLKGPTNRAW